MKLLLYGLSIAVIVTAKPELYREKEDFQYARSSSDEGTKSGYYDAQRGNMGGNFERAHNMDTLAQHQMGGLVKQVEGELGDGYKTRTGSVFTAANSQGVYGQGRYDLSNLAGRNFQEGTTFHDSQSYLSSGSRAHSSQYSALNNARYNSDSLSHGAGFNGFQQSDNLQAQNSFGTKGYEHGSESQRSSKYYLQSVYSGSNDYERSNLNQQASSNFGSANTQNRLISTLPVRIVVRPGTRVAIPVATQTQQTHSGSHVASYDQMNANNEAEVLSSGDHQSALRPNGDAKHYESSYSYHKEWEKHDTKPVAVPVPSPVFPIAKNSELYDDSRLHHGSGYTQNADYNLASSQVRQQAGYNSQHSASSESRHQADYIAQQHAASSNLNQQSAASSNLHSNDYIQSGYNSDVNSQSANLIGAVSSKPKSYQSSYSYHKSWERQGDPYVIIPPSNGAYAGETNQRLTDLSGSQAEYSSHNYGSRKSHQSYSIKDCVIECDPNSHMRVARSYNSGPAQFEEQNQNINSDQESWGQQSQSNWGEMQNLGQQIQNQWEQQYQDAGQQVQNKWDNLEDLGQQTQNKWDQLSQDAGQQTQNKWDNLEDLGQQTQNKWDQLSQDAGQQTQNKWDKLEDLGQQTQNKWDFGQQTQTTGEEVVNGWNNLESQKVEDQQIQDNWNTQTQTQNRHSKPVELDDVGHHADTPRQPSRKVDQEQQVSFEGTQQNEHKHNNFWDKVSVFYQSQAFDNKQMTFEQTLNQQKPLEESQTLDLSQQTQGFEIEHPQMFENHNGFYQSNNYDKTQEQKFQTFDLSQQTDDKDPEQRVSFDDSQQIEHKNISFWDKISDFDQTQSFDSQKTDEHTLDQQKSQEQPLETLDLSQQTQNNWDSQKHDNNNFGQLDQALGHSLGKHDQEQQVSFEGIQQTEQRRSNFWDNVSIFHQTQASDNQQTYEQTINQQKPKEDSQTLDLGQQTQGFEIEQAHKFDSQNGFDKFNNPAKQTDDLNHQTQRFWNQFTDSQTNTQQHKNTGSLNGLWGKLDDLDGDISPSNVNLNTPQDSGFSQTSSSENTNNWNQESSISHETSSKAGVNEQNVNHNRNKFYDNRNPYKDFASDEVENDFLVVPILHDVTTKTSIDEDIRPVDIGRGDIGPDDDDSLIHVTYSTIEESSVDKLNHKYTTENYEDTVEMATNENNLESYNRTSDKPYKKDLIHVTYSTTEATSVDNLEDKYTTENYDGTVEKATHENDLESYNRPSDKTYKKDVSVEEAPEEFEQKFETQNVQQEYQLNEHKFDFSNQNTFQKHNSDQEQQNAEFKPENWELFSSHKYGHNDNADQQFVDFSQTNQQWNLDQQNIQQQFPDDFYQQNQHAQLQNSHTDFDQHNVEESPLSDFGQENVKSEFEIVSVKEQEKTDKKNNIEVLAQQPNSNNIQEKSSTNTTPQTITEKPGFWKSIGNKFASAKDKVASWFK